MRNDLGSFRDPSGQVFCKDNKIYRGIFEPGVRDFEAAREAGVYKNLIAAGFLIPHEEVFINENAPEGTVYCLEHPCLPFISYPWEWTFSMFKDAALLHLDMMERLVPAGFWLRDASAFNVQYDGQRLRLIDTLSVGRRLPESPWVAYRQFCSHFLAPLVMAAYCDIRTLGLWRNYIDGFPLDLAVKMLPLWRRYIPGLFMHLTIHSRFQDSADRLENVKEKTSPKNPKVSDAGLVGIIRSLRRTIENITWKRSSKIWENYENIRTYQEEAVAAKSEYVQKVIQRLKPQMVWDLGANIGEFSLIAASNGAFVLSIEGDPACTEHLYQRLSKETDLKKILPLTIDLANPSPGLGWEGKERLSLRERGPADLILALALIHHLVFSNCVPLTNVAKWFADLTSNLLIEFVPPEDPMVQKLMQNRKDDHLPYNIEIFQSSFGTYFDVEDRLTLQNDRTMYLFRRKD